MNSSIALLPKGTRSPWVDPQPRVAAGSIKESNYPSKIFGGARRVWIYHPPVDAGSLAGLLICLWGKDYLNEIPVPTILDNLLNQRRIFPLTAVFIDNDGDRFQSFQRTKQIAESLATELIPWIRSQDKLPADPRRTIIAGYSAAALASAYAAFKYPELIGNVLSQSGAFWRGFEGEGASEYEWLAAQYNKMPKQQTRFFLHVGSREDRPAGGSGPVFKEANSRLRDVLVKRGYEVAYEEVKDADHEFMHWRGKFADGLLYLTSK
jgi:enterochelin esterase family protein